jgi:hypothetical protein
MVISKLRDLERALYITAWHDETATVSSGVREAHPRFPWLFRPAPPPDHPTSIVPWVAGRGSGTEQPQAFGGWRRRTKLTTPA